VWSRLKNADWLLAYQQKASDAYAVLTQAQKLTIVIFLIGVGGIIIAAILLAKRLVRHIAKMEMEKEMMNEQVIEAGKLASIGELAAGIAHEINNPVAVMVEEAGWIRDLLDEDDLKETANLEEFKRSLNQIQTQGHRCKQITHKLLSFARKTDPTVKLVQVNEVIEDVISLSQQRALYATVKIETNLDPDLPKVEASPSELQQVFLNMINNSLDAMDSKGGTIEVISRVSGRFVVVDVADTGVGIPRSNLQRIFDPFFTTKPVGKGTGLGLSICYGIMKKMGGDLTVNSAVGLGTTFHIHIPMTQAVGG
jgi:two-component system NtrC family sensor kinase